MKIYEVFYKHEIHHNRLDKRDFHITELHEITPLDGHNRPLPDILFRYSKYSVKATIYASNIREALDDFWKLYDMYMESQGTYDVIMDKEVS